MPNYCENLLIIRGSKKQREEFKKKYCEKVHLEYSNKDVISLIFENVIPEPKTIEECPEAYVIHNAEEARQHCLSWEENDERRWFNWYNWRRNYWQTKWEGLPVHSEETKTSLRLWFDTAWTPPIGVIRKLILDNYNLKIVCKFDEPGMDIHGKIMYSDFDNPEDLKEDK